MLEVHSWFEFWSPCMRGLLVREATETGSAIRLRTTHPVFFDRMFESVEESGDLSMVVPGRFIGRPVYATLAKTLWSSYITLLLS